jgi:hypothetical protein
MALQKAGQGGSFLVHNATLQLFSDEVARSRQRSSNYVRSLGGLSKLSKPRKPQDWRYIFLQDAVSPDFSRYRERHFLTRDLAHSESRGSMDL